MKRQLIVSMSYKPSLKLSRFEYPDSLDDAAEAVSQPIQTTDFISKEMMHRQWLNSAQVMQALESPEVKEDGLNSEVIEVAPEHVVSFAWKHPVKRWCCHLKK